MFALLSAAFAFSACESISSRPDSTVVLQSQGVLAMKDSAGSWRTQAVLIVRQNESGAVRVEVRDSKNSLALLSAALSSTLDHGTRELEPMSIESSHSGLELTRGEVTSASVTRVATLRSLGLSINAGDFFSGSLTSTGRRWASYREGFLRTGRDSRVELTLALAGGRSVSFLGHTASRDQEMALGTSGPVQLEHQGANAWMMLGHEARFGLDLPGRSGWLESPGRWRRDFTFEVGETVRGAFEILNRDAREVEVHDRLVAQLTLRPMEGQIEGRGLVDYDLSIAFSETAIAVSGTRRFTAEVEQSGERSARTRMTLAPQAMRWPLIAW